jgi:hypothetical protein
VPRVDKNRCVLAVGLFVRAAWLLKAGGDIVIMRYQLCCCLCCRCLGPSHAAPQVWEVDQWINLPSLMPWVSSWKLLLTCSGCATKAVDMFLMCN